jgi:hypothetical protein
MPGSTGDQFFIEETNRLNEKNDQVSKLADSQQRLTLLNDSYRKRYAKYVQIMMVLVLAYVVHLGMLLLKKTALPIPSIVFDFGEVLLIFLVAYYLFNAFSTLLGRTPTNYDELNVASLNDGSGVDAQSILDEGKLSKSTLGLEGGDICVGENCCPADFVWDQALNKCVMKSTGVGLTGSAYDPTTGRYRHYTANGNVVTFDGFTTREYSSVNQQEVRTDDPSLKRSPDGGNIIPTYVNTSLEFSPLM